VRFSKIGVGLLAAAAIVAGGCNDSSMTKGSHGNVRFVMGGGATTNAVATGGVSAATALSDGTGRSITSATITLSSVLARNLDGQLIDVTIDLPMDVDLVALINGRTVELPMGALPAGSYDQLVIVIRALTIGLSDGTTIAVTPPGGGWTAIVPTEAFDVTDGAVTTVHLTFRAEGSFRWIDGHLEFRPTFDCDVDDHHGDDDDDD